VLPQQKSYNDNNEKKEKKKKDKQKVLCNSTGIIDTVPPHPVRRGEQAAKLVKRD